MVISLKKLTELEECHIFVIMYMYLNQLLWEESRNYSSFGDNYLESKIENFPLITQVILKEWKPE